jgi:curved DNA-binding protein
MRNEFNSDKILKNVEVFLKMIGQSFREGFEGKPSTLSPRFSRGEDLRLDLEIELRESVVGCKKDIHIRRLEIGSKNELEEVVRSLRITIPAGVRAGSKLRYEGQGDVCKIGGKTGDLYIFILISS